MKRKTDIYHRWVGWSEEEQAYIGRCPDLFLGGVHGQDPLKVARELQKVIDEWETIFESDARQLPPARVKPTMELA
jgi:predicted RNase H-like HicB family nuclease